MLFLQFHYIFSDLKLSFFVDMWKGYFGKRFIVV